MKHELGKICFIIPYVGGGGAERVVAVLTSELAEQGYDVLLIKYYACANEYPVSAKVRVRTLTHSEDEYRHMSYLSRVRSLRKIVSEEKPQYVVPFMSHVARHMFFATLGKGCKQIQTIRIAPWVAPQSRLLRAFRDILIYISHSTFVQTQSQKDYFPRLIHKKIAVIPNPVSESMLCTEWLFEKRLSRILCVGRLVEQKNFQMAIDAVSRLRNDGYQVELDIYGVGENYEKLQAYITEEKAEAFCHLMGRSNEMSQVYASHHIFLLTSNFEGLPNTLMEAMAVGMPCVATDCETGPAELIAIDRGILVPVNDLESVVLALKNMINDPACAAAMGKRAKQFMQASYSPSVIAKMFIEQVICRNGD